MSRRRNILVALGLTALVLLSTFLALVTFFIQEPKNSTSSTLPFLVGVEIGWRASVAEVKAQIDEVKNFTNLLVIGTGTITCNEVWLNETCDYAVNAGMYVMVYFSDQFYSNQEVTNTQGNSYHPLLWVVEAKKTYGDHFLGAYYMDEPGGAELDSAFSPGNGNVYGPGGSTNYQEAADYFVKSKSGNMDVISYISHNANSSLFTSDYGLYWFDYKAGYDVILAQFGANNSRPLQIALARGAAEAQHKDWGIMITWTYRQTPYLESGPQLYDDMVLAYDSGSKYIAVYDASQGWQNTTLTDEHYDALRNFWNYMQQNPSKHGSLKADTALVLPKDYGFGFRSPSDSVWEFKHVDSWTERIYNDVGSMLSAYNGSLDIVYNDPDFNGAVQSHYDKVITWTSGAETDGNYPIINLNNTLGYRTIQEAINSPATYNGNVLKVRAGTYHENLVVNRAITLIGENTATTIIDGGGNGTAVNIVSSSVNMTGFTVRNGGNFTSGIGGGILLNNANNCNISGNAVTDSYYGVALQDSANNTLRNNSISRNKYDFGVTATTSAGYANDIDPSNTVNGKPIYYWVRQHDQTVPQDAGYVALINCTDITAQNLAISSNGNGLLIAYTKNSTVYDNTFTHNAAGIILDGAEGNTLRNNTITDSLYNFWVINALPNDIDTSNNVSGKPIYYWVNQHHKTVPPNAGYVALIDCSDITVQNLQLSNNGQGILLSNTTNSTITQNTFANNVNGAELNSAQNNDISGNNLIANVASGFGIAFSDWNTFLNNTLTGSQVGIVVNASSNNSVSHNNITQNSIGIQFANNLSTNSSFNSITENWITANQNYVDVEYGAASNTFYHNNIANNTNQIPSGTNIYGSYPTPSSYPAQINIGSYGGYFPNAWDNGKEGNYWSEYTGTDANHDGIGDTPYTVYGYYYSYYGQDNYPLMQPFQIG